MTCKGASHHGDCPNDESLHQVLQLAGQQLWQRCQNCRAMIELNVGCNHITYVKRSFTDSCSTYLHSVAVDAVINSATSVALFGGLAVAITGPRHVYWSVLLR